jgi:hypothetical protein
MTAKELTAVALAKAYMPSQFVAKVSDDVVLAFINLVLAEINVIPPYTEYSIENCPTMWNPIIAWASQVYSVLFLHGGFALQDFSYSDGGLSLTINRQANLDLTYKNMLERFIEMAKNIKKVEALKVGVRLLTTPRYDTVFTQYLSMIFPGTWPMK